MKEKIKVIIDHIGRTVIGEELESTETYLTLNNPVIIHVQPNPSTNQIEVQSFPYIFMEFLTTESRTKNYWKFNKQNIVESDVELESRIIEQYKTINNPPKQVVAEDNGPDSDPEVIRLFE